MRRAKRKRPCNCLRGLDGSDNTLTWLGIVGLTGAFVYILFIRPEVTV